MNTVRARDRSTLYLLQRVVCAGVLLASLVPSAMADAIVRAPGDPPAGGFVDTGWPVSGPVREVAPAAPCAGLPGVPIKGLVQRQGQGSDWTVDPCGNLHVAPGYAGRTPATEPWSAVRGALAVASVAATIDSMTAGSFFSDSYSPFNGLGMLGFARTYYLSDGRSWQSGAGSARLTRAQYHHATVTADTIRYFLLPPPDSTIYEQTDYDSGDHSAQGVLKTTDMLEVVALAGSNVAWITGQARVASNEATWYGEPRFNFYSALPGAVVPYRVRLTNLSGSWSATSFDGSFSYSMDAVVDFTRPLSSPALERVQLSGPSQVPDRTTVQYTAIAEYVGGARRDVTGRAVWSASPASIASADAGQLTIGALGTPEADVLLEVSFTAGGVTRTAQLSVRCRRDLLAGSPSAWATYQANERHDGHVPLRFDATAFVPIWSASLTPGSELNPVAAADGVVFASRISYFGTGDGLFALDARDGHIMWTRAYGGFSINPPAAAYGNVYLQTCNHSTDTWLHAYDARTGTLVFDAPHEAQWERYLAPTPYEGHVYVDGGYYGGMYAFDALSGARSWFLSLPQYDQWTPSLDADLAYAYVGDYSPGLYAVHRADGSQAFKIPDAGFRWDGWSMYQAAALGAHSDAFAAHDGRLLRFDLAARTIAWQKPAGFTGQPSVAHDRVYAIRSGSLVVFDEVSGTEQWSWTPRGPGLAGTLIVTDSHVLTSSADSVYAVGLDSHVPEWSLLASGKLALADGQLYIASTSGTLRAVRLATVPAVVVHAAAGPDTSLECASADGAGTPVRFDGRASTGTELEYLWTAPGVTFDDPTSDQPTGRFPTGTTEVVLTVTSGSESARDTSLVQVTDTQPPLLSVILTPGRGEVPRKDWIPVHATVTVEDACDASSSWMLASITPVAATRHELEDEHRGAGDDDERDRSRGEDEDDVDGEGGEHPGNLFVRDADLGTADADFLLWAGNGHKGRSYTVCYESHDASGHSASLCQRLTVTRPRRADLPADAPAPEQPAPAFGVTPLHEPVVFAALVSPNPARGDATIRYSLPSPGHVRLRIFDVHGRLVRTLVDDERGAGAHLASLPASGRGLRMYAYLLEWSGQRRTGKFVLTD